RRVRPGHGRPLLDRRGRLGPGLRGTGGGNAHEAGCAPMREAQEADMRRAHPGFLNHLLAPWRLGALAILSACLLSCRPRETFVDPDPHLERMLSQPKVVPYGEPMLQPPDGTLPVTASLDPPSVRVGVTNGRWVDRIPVTVDRAMMDDGRRNFDRYCATC